MCFLLFLCRVQKGKTNKHSVQFDGNKTKRKNEITLKKQRERGGLSETNQRLCPGVLIDNKHCNNM